MAITSFSDREYVCYYHRESHEYVRSLVTTAAETVESVDMSMLVVDAVKRLDEAAIDAMAKVVTTSAQVASPIMLVMNKYDLVGEREEINMNLKIKDISEMIEEIYANNFDADESSLELDPLAYIGDNSLKVSALKGYGMKRLKKTLVSLAVDRPWCDTSLYMADLYRGVCGFLTVVCVLRLQELPLVHEVGPVRPGPGDGDHSREALPPVQQGATLHVRAGECVRLAEFPWCCWKRRLTRLALCRPQWMDQVQGQEHPDRPGHLCAWRLPRLNWVVFSLTFPTPCFA
jgi:hypothetical protein